jgi:hypothetical protein
MLDRETIARKPPGDLAARPSERSFPRSLETAVTVSFFPQLGKLGGADKNSVAEKLLFSAR